MAVRRVHDPLEDLAVQFQRDLRPKSRGLGILQLLDPVPEAVHLVLQLDGRGVGVHQRHRAAGADPLPFRALKPQRSAALIRQYRFLPDHIAGDVNGLLHLVLVSEARHERVVQIPQALDAEIHQHRQRHRRQQQFCSQ